MLFLKNFEQKTLFCQNALIEKHLRFFSNVFIAKLKLQNKKFLGKVLFLLKIYIML